MDRWATLHEGGRVGFSRDRACCIHRRSALDMAGSGVFCFETGKRFAFVVWRLASGSHGVEEIPPVPRAPCGRDTTVQIEE